MMDIKLYSVHMLRGTGFVNLSPYYPWLWFCLIYSNCSSFYEMKSYEIGSLSYFFLINCIFFLCFQKRTINVYFVCVKILPFMMSQ